MANSTSLRPHLPSSYAYTYTRHFSKLCSHRLHGKHNGLSFFITTTRCCAVHRINSILGDRKYSTNGNWAPEPARVLLERLFAQTQKLEEQLHCNFQLDKDANSDFDLQNLETDLHDVLDVIRKREEDLQEAEKQVISEHAELTEAREELESREKKILAACSKQEKLEEELRQANLKLISQARHIEDLKLQLSQRDQEIAMAKSGLSSKEAILEKMSKELTQKNAEAFQAESELKSKAQLLDEAHSVVKKQEIELQVLRSTLHDKQEQLEELLARQQLEEDKVKAAEVKLEKRTMEWLLAQEELRKLGEESSEYIGASKETLEDFQRVKMLLADVRCELVSSQQSLVTSRNYMTDRELLLEKLLLELEEQKETVMSYLNSLKNAQIEVESERAKQRIAEARNKELELDLSMKRDLMHDIQEELDKEKTSLQNAIQELSSLQEELNKKNIEFEETNYLLEVKGRELVEARMEIQHLDSERQSLQLVLQERDVELVTTKKRLEEVGTEVGALRTLLNGKEDQLTVATDMLKEKEDYALAMQLQFDDAQAKASVAETAVGRIVDLTEELVSFIKEDDQSTFVPSGFVGQLPLQILEKPTKDYWWQKKQLEAELELTKENLRTREMELLATQRLLAIKDEELKVVLQRLEEKDAKLKEVREKMLKDADEQMKLSRFAQDGASHLQDLAIEKLQLEAAQLEVEAATSALHKLVEMSRQLLNKATLSLDADLDVNVIQQIGHSSMAEDLSPGDEIESNSSVIRDDKCFTEVKSEVARLSALTERLVQEASAVSAAM